MCGVYASTGPTEAATLSDPKSKNLEENDTAREINSAIVIDHQFASIE
jgi:hypothetical protein